MSLARGGGAGTRLTDLDLRRRYSTGRMDLIGEFFTPCIGAAANYDRAVGFFSSTFYMLIGIPLARFAHRGGKMRVVCCPRLSPVDIDAMADGYAARSAASALLREIDECLEDPVGMSIARLLSAMIGTAVLDLRIAFRPGQAGVFHDKLGIFRDNEGNCVTFDGSANESWSAWADEGNYEAFHAFTSWSDSERVSDDVEYFESLWANQEPGLEVIPFPSVARERLEAMAGDLGLEGAEEQARAAILQRSVLRSRGVPPLRRHQLQVLDDWRRRSHRGIIEHATGSGKTITALVAAGDALDAGRPVLIVVPWATILEQWRVQLGKFFGESVDVLLAGLGHNEWRKGATLRNFLEPGARRVVIAMLDTASSVEFAARLQGAHPMCLIVDEVHRAGSRMRRGVLEAIDADWRLGLSATWQREGDPEGTEVIFKFFERVLDPVYTLKNALDDGFLSPYRYIIHPLSLTKGEREEYGRLSQVIARALARSDGNVSEPIRQLLIKRARVIKKAAGKPALAAEILREHFRDGDAWLVYCDDTSQLRAVRRAVEAQGLRCLEYHRQVLGAEEESFSEFERGGGILLAIRCLDEGVDIPRIDHALVIASSTTRREFIQRRGRVLRRADRKFRAEIHDMLVDAGGFDSSRGAQFLRNEVARAQELASSAEDSSAARLVLDGWERYLISLSAATGPSPEGADGTFEEREE